MKKLLLLGTSNGTGELLKCAREMGVYTIVTDNIPIEQSKVKQMADTYWMISTADLDELEKKCKEDQINGIACGSSDFNQEMAVELCERLGLCYYCTKDAWHYSRDKGDFKKLARKMNAPIPEDYFISDALTDQELGKIKYPVVVKPVDLSGNRGVSYCYNKEDLIQAYRYARSVSAKDNIIVERMLDGEEWYSSYAIAEGEASLLALNAMYAEPGEPKNCYTITTTVSRYVEKYIREINPYITKLLKEVGCTDGVAWVQVMLDKDGNFYIIEMGYRMDGEKMFTIYDGVIGFDAVKWIVEASLGMKHKSEELPAPQEKAFTKCATGMMLWTNKSGIITEIQGIDEIRKIPGVVVKMNKDIGDKISRYSAAGIITFNTDEIEETCQIINDINQKIHIFNEHGEDVIIKYTDFDYLREVYELGLAGK